MDVFGGRLRASEGAYFKSEQERDIEKMRRQKQKEEDERMRLRKELGADDADDENEEVLKLAAVVDGENVSNGNAPLNDRWDVDKLVSVCAEEARFSRGGTLDRVIRRRLRSELGVSRVVAGESALGDVSELSTPCATPGSSIFDAQSGVGRKLNRRDWMREVTLDLKRAAESRRAMSPMELKALEATHVAHRRALVAGARALVYGSVLAVVGVVGGSAVASAWLEIHSHDDFRRAFKSTFEPYVQRARDSAEPYKSRFASASQRVSDVDSNFNVAAKSKLSRIENSEFVAKLRAKLGTSQTRDQ